MDNIKQLIKELFKSVDRYFLIRQYFFAIVLFLFLILSGPFNFSTFFILLLNTLLYPFAKITFDFAISFIFGNQVIILPIILMIAYNLFKFVALYMFAIFISPISIAYILIKNNALLYNLNVNI